MGGSLWRGRHLFWEINCPIETVTWLCFGWLGCVFWEGIKGWSGTDKGIRGWAVRLCLLEASRVKDSNSGV